MKVVLEEYDRLIAAIRPVPPDSDLLKERNVDRGLRPRKRGNHRCALIRIAITPH